MIPEKEYKKIIQVLPILCVDVIIVNEKKEYLLVKRKNEPLKGEWWVVGGRLEKGEAAERAAIRKIKEETSLRVSCLNFVGYYEGWFDKNAFGVPGQLHTVSIVFSAVIEGEQRVVLDSQSSEWVFSARLPDDFQLKISKGCIQ